MNEQRNNKINRLCEIFGKVEFPFSDNMAVWYLDSGDAIILTESNKLLCYYNFVVVPIDIFLEAIEEDLREKIIYNLELFR